MPKPERTRIVSLVPSWTETLIEAGCHVVGRTRFCIHPSDKVSSIKSLGGTKNVNWQKLKDLDPDLVILDKEENKKEFIDKIPCDWWASHVQSIHNISEEMMRLNQILKNDALDEFSQRWQKIRKQKLHWNWQGVEWLKKDRKDYQKVYYIIWKKPWMAVSRETFIGSILEHLGVGNLYSSSAAKYPEIDIDSIGPESLVLFSTEPFPFHAWKEDLKQYPFDSGIIDGEYFSWFGVRSLRFLESLDRLD